jgi:hypothetical protein
LHERLITLFKGILKAWEDWLREIKQEESGPSQTPAKAQD